MSKTLTKKKISGFTLLETLVAIAVLAMAIGAAFTMAQKSIESGLYSRDQTTAVFLATEGLEMVRAVRDNTILYNTTNSTSINWLSMNLIANCMDNAGNSCDLNPTSDLYANISNLGGLDSGDVTPCGSSGCPLRLYTLSNGDMVYSSVLPSGHVSTNQSSASSIYSRKITLTTVPESITSENLMGEVLVTSTVYWKQASTNESYSVSEILTNWNDSN